MHNDYELELANIPSTGRCPADLEALSPLGCAVFMSIHHAVIGRSGRTLIDLLADIPDEFMVLVQNGSDHYSPRKALNSWLTDYSASTYPNS